jgi:hypothetical protein
LKKLLGFIYRLLFVLFIIIFTIAIFAFIEWLQSKLFIPNDYIMWVVKPPLSRLVFIYEIYLFFAYYIIFRKDFRKTFFSFLKRNRSKFFIIFPIVNFVLLYVILTNVTVITSTRITDFTITTPKGINYQYHDITNITTGVYGEKQLFGHSKGDFYYIVAFKDGKKIDWANDVGAVKNNIDERFILNKLDKKLVNMGIPKKSSMANFKYTTKSLDKIYTDKIKSILERKSP